MVNLLDDSNFHRQTAVMTRLIELIFEIWWNFFYDLFSIKNVADVNSIDSFVRKTEYGGIFCCYHEEVQIELV